MTDASPPGARSHAVIIGASIGGMCAAAALSRHFQRITLIERDRLSRSPEVRRGVPQSGQPHGLMKTGRTELNRLFPSLHERLLARGALEFDGCTEIARYGRTGWTPRYVDLGADAFACSRPLLEVTIREIFRERYPNARILEGTRVTGPIFRRDGRGVWVTGVRTDCPDEDLREIQADLVIDASGRGSQAARWLANMGLPEPVMLRVDSKSNYAVRHYRRPPEAERWWWKTLIVDHAPPDFRRSCTILSIEDNRWLVTAISAGGDYAPTEESAWLAYLKSLRSPVAYEAVKHAEPLTDVIQSRTTVNMWRLMHRYDAPLHGLLLFGDAVCGFNPTYGQGMTAAALAAKTLDAVLSRHRGPLEASVLRHYYKGQARFLRQGWELSTWMDFRWSETEGKRPFMYGAQLKLMHTLERIAVHDPGMLRRLVPLADFGASHLSLLSPDFVGRTLIGVLRDIVQRPRLPGPTGIDVFGPSSNVPLLPSR